MPICVGLVHRGTPGRKTSLYLVLVSALSAYCVLGGVSTMADVNPWREKHVAKDYADGFPFDTYAMLCGWAVRTSVHVDCVTLMHRLLTYTALNVQGLLCLAFQVRARVGVGLIIAVSAVSLITCFW